MKPHWNGNRRELTLNGVVVKRFRQPSANQEAVLAAFEEEGWPEKVYDPLPPSPVITPQRRLQDTVYRLNRRQFGGQLIKFSMDGTGEAVLWQITPNNGSDGSASEERRMSRTKTQAKVETW